MNYSEKKENHEEWSSDEMMTIAAARSLQDYQTCFVGIGIPSTAAILAKSMHAPNLFLIYESGAVNTSPKKLPLSIGDDDLATNALAVVSMPEIFNYWLQPGRINIGFLGGAQLDKYGNINSTFIGQSYEKPKVRLPGAGGAPEIAGACQEVTIIMRQTTRTFVKNIDFITTLGYGDGSDVRRKANLRGLGPTTVISNLGILKPDPETSELTLVQLHPNIDVEEAIQSTGWDLKIAKDLKVTDKPSKIELDKIRKLMASSSKQI